jgi:hypothetical protein
VFLLYPRTYNLRREQELRRWSNRALCV